VKKKLKINGTGPLAKACEICVYDGKEDLEKSFFKKEKKMQQIVAELQANDVDATPYKWYKHMREHVLPVIMPTAVDIAPELATDIVDMVGDIAGIVDRLKRKAEQMDMDDVTDNDTIKTWISLNVALGQAVERIGRVTGDLKGVTNVKQQNVKYEFNNFAGQLLQDLCPVCKAKVAVSIEPLIKKTE
jgi:hypothetical protein